jgi:acyl-CoA synthetase (AMP-forming)/AMP-acid ligase II
MLSTIPWAQDLKAATDAFADLPCISDGVRELTFAALGAKAAALGTELSAAGVKPGEPVATCLRNGIPAVWTSYAVKLVGAAETGLNPALGPEEKRYFIKLAGVRRVVTSAAEADFFRALGCAVLTVDAVPECGAPLAGFAPVPGEAWGRINFTSGTTGRPKAIVTSHARRWLGHLLLRASLPYMPRPGSRILLMTPFTHGAALLAYCFLDRGAAVTLLDGVDIAAVEPILASGRVDHLFAPPTVLAKLTAAFEGRRFEGIRTAFCGTAPLTPAVYRRARALFGPVVRVTYGKSEVTNPIATLAPGPCDDYYMNEATDDGFCVGWPGSGVEIEVRREGGGACAEGEVGEVHLRARHMLIGTIDDGGFHPQGESEFHATGDLGRLDARGRLHLVGRSADVIKSGGYKVHPDEIETALAASAEGGAVSVISLPSEYWGEVIVAVAEAAPAGWPARAREAVAGLAKYKQPRFYLTVESLPRNAQGKVPRARLRALVLERHRLVDGAHPSLVGR